MPTPLILFMLLFFLPTEVNTNYRFDQGEKLCDEYGGLSYISIEPDTFNAVCMDGTNFTELTTET